MLASLPDKLFGMFDVNSDGAISLDEWEKQFDVMDRWNTGAVSRKAWAILGGSTEFFDSVLVSTKNATSKQHFVREDWSKAFAVFDKNADGKLSKEEFEAGTSPEKSAGGALPSKGGKGGGDHDDDDDDYLYDDSDDDAEQYKKWGIGKEQARGERKWRLRKAAMAVERAAAEEKEYERELALVDPEKAEALARAREGREEAEALARARREENKRVRREELAQKRLADEELHLRLAAVRALAQKGDLESVAALRACLNDEEPRRVRLAAAEELAQVAQKGDLESAAALRACLAGIQIEAQALELKLRAAPPYPPTNRGGYGVSDRMEDHPQEVAWHAQNPESKMLEGLVELRIAAVRALAQVAD